MNPALAYGQGTPGNQTQAQQAVTPDLPDWAAILGQSVNNLNTTLMQQTQRQLIEANTQNVTAKTSTEVVKKQILERNPMLNDTVFESRLSEIISKGQEQGARTQSAITDFQTKAENLKAAQRYNKISDMYMETKMAKEVDLLFQRFKINEADLKIKAEILNSKEFLNEFSRLEMEFIKSGNMNFGHWAAFGKLLLSKIGGLKAH